MRIARLTFAVAACVLGVFASNAAAASTPIALPKDFTIAAVDGQFVYATSERAGENDDRAELIRIDTTSNTNTRIFKADQPVSWITHVTARSGKVAFVTEVMLNGNVISVPFVKESKLRLIKSDSAAPVVIQTITRRSSASGKADATCGGEFVHAEFLTSSRIQTMVTMFGKKLGAKRCKTQPYSRSFGRDQRQQIRWMSFAGKTLDSLNLNMGGNLEQNGGIFSFNRDGDQLAFPERTSFRALLTRNGKGRRIEIPNARRVDHALALGGGAVLVDFVLKKKRDNFFREQRLFPNFMRSNRSILIQRLHRSAMAPARCGFGWIAENSVRDELIAYNRQGKPVGTVLKGPDLWGSDQPICNSRKVILDPEFIGPSLVDLPRIP